MACYFSFHRLMLDSPYSLIDCQQNIFYILMQYVFVPLPPLLDPIWPNQLYKKALQLHTRRHIHTYTLCELIGWSSHWSLRGLQLNRAIIRVWMTMGEGSTLPLSSISLPFSEARSCSSDNSAVDLCYPVSSTLKELTRHTKRSTLSLSHTLTPSGQGSVWWYAEVTK